MARPSASALAASREPIMVLAEALAAPPARGGWRIISALGQSRAFGAIPLLAPAVLFFVVVFVIPVGLMIRYSFYQQTTTGDLTAAATLANYVRLGSVDPHRPRTTTRLRVTLWTTFTT